jgi:hypothetical protein
MIFNRNTRHAIRVRSIVIKGWLSGVDREIHLIEQLVSERPGNRVPKLPPRRLDVQRRIIQPCRARHRMGRKGRIT